ncbi:MAG TPA: ATP-binding protein [Anaerolineae bacterium]|nr:ATP-binding protein [Anaerolineae bacterium]HNT06080.1 ATP-binding protein [Anaerolineae bacterium]
MKWLLDQTSEHLDKGLAALVRNDLTDARFHYLKASEYLFKAAEQSEGTLRDKRLALAEELLERATAIGKRLEVGGKRRPNEPLVDASTKAAAWLVAERPNVTFGDVAGLEEVKEQIRLKLIHPYAHPELAQKFGIRKGGGILLYGPPGTGKTLIARAVAGEVDAAFFTVKPSEIMSKWVGEAEQNVDALFKAARSYERSVIFMDELDALLPKRRETVSSVMPRVINQILTELQGFHDQERGLLFMGATNEPWSLDPAALRPGRFDERIYVPLPDVKARLRILELNLRGKPVASDVDLGALAASLAGYSGADVTNICLKACVIPFLEAVNGGVERQVEPRDFQAVMATVRPSVSAKDIARFEKFSFE